MLFVSSAGGHLAQLMELRSWWQTRGRTWVTHECPTTQKQLEGETVIPAYFPTTRSIRSFLKNCWLAWRVIPRVRPDLVVSTGAGVAVPFFIVAKLSGIPTVFLEVFDRVNTGTLTGRLVMPLASQFLVQLPQQLNHFPQAQLLGPLWAGPELDHDSTKGTGPVTPQLLVIVGTDHHPFQRLIDWVDRYLDDHVEVDVPYVCQHGTSQPPRHGQPHRWLAHDEVQSLLARSTAVVVQGGPYCIAESLQHGRTPIVVPRIKRLGEVVDDHQIDFCTFLGERGDVITVTDESAFREALDIALSQPDLFRVGPNTRAAERDAAVERFATLVCQERPRHGRSKRMKRGHKPQGLELG